MNVSVQIENVADLFSASPIRVGHNASSLLPNDAIAGRGDDVDGILPEGHPQ